MNIEELESLKLQTEIIGKGIEGFLNKTIYVFVINSAFCLDVIMVDLLKLRGVLKETDLEPFSKDLRGKIISMNHQDGNEWFFVYRRFFKPIYLVAPWMILRDLPRTWADRENFLGSSLTGLAMKAMIPVDRNEDGWSEVPFKESLAAINSAGLVGFFEGHRTPKCANIRLSQKGEPLGQLSESLGLFAKMGIPIKSVYAGYLGSSFHSLPYDGKFRSKIFLLWYWKTFWKKNGEIHIVWGETRKFESVEEKDPRKIRKIATLQFEDYMLELADKA